MVRPSLRTVEGPGGSAKGEPRVIQVLVALADARGQVLSREDLLQLCWEGRIVGDDAINRAIGEVRRIAAATNAGFEIETVPRIGYRLAGLDWGNGSVESAEPDKHLRVGRRALLVGGAAALAATAGTWAVVDYRRRNSAVDSLIERGRVAQGSGRPSGDAEAEALFRQAIARDPGRADAWGWLAVVLHNNDQARQAAQRALAIDPSEPNARTVLAYQRRDLDAWTRWEDTLLDILKDAPHCAIALNNLTFFYQGMGRCRDSWTANERAIREEPFNPGPQQRRALKHWIFGRVGDADKVADRALQLWPHHPGVWNARMLIYAFTDRAPAALALLDDSPSRPTNLTAPSVASWRAALTAIASRSPRDIAKALDVCTGTASLAPGLAANAIMFFSYLGELDAAYRVAEGLFEARGAVVQRLRGGGIKDLYSSSSWGRTQFLFIPATTSFRADPRFPGLCRRMGHADYWRRRGVWPDPFVRGSIDPATLT
jgi:tetratricopeptide (TPR) repeat protein